MVDRYNVENAVIGCILAGDHAGEIFGIVTSEDFLNLENQEIFRRLKVMWDLYGNIDIVNVSSFPVEQKELAVLCFDTVRAFSQWKKYALLLKEQTAQIKATSIAMEIAMGNYELDEIQEKGEKLLQVANGNTQSDSLDMKQGILNFMKEKSTPREYLKTGYKLLDKYSYIDKGDYIVIGGRPSAGKTAFSITLLLNMAKSGKRVIFFSLETSPKKIMDRIVTSYCGLNFGNVKMQEMGKEWDKVAEKSDELAKLPIDIISASGKSVAWMQAEAVRRKADVVVIDYIGLIPAEGNSRYEKMTNVSINLHNFSQQTGIVVIALSQLNRGGASKEPSMEDLRESGQIEQDADLILLLHNDQEAQIYKVIIEKNKEGECAAIRMDFDGRSQQFQEWETRY